MHLIDKQTILPPGGHPCDPAKTHIDPVGYALERAGTYLCWVEEHRATFEALRSSDVSRAETELRHLRDSTEAAIRHLKRLTELLLAGYSFDVNKRLPRGDSALLNYRDVPKKLKDP